MDLGVGSFVFADGIIYGIKLVEDPAPLTFPVMPKFLRAALQTLLFIVPTYIIRYVLIRVTNYPVTYLFGSFFLYTF
jgi:phosphatidylinositol glycan class W